MKPISIDRLPHSKLAETHVLGAILLDESALPVAREQLAAEDFYLSPQQDIYRAMCLLADEKIAVDFITVCDLLRQQNKLESSGGEAAIFSLTDGLPRSHHVRHYARIVARCARMRQALDLSVQLAQAAQNDAEDITSLCVRYMAKLENIMQQYAGEDNARLLVPAKEFVNTLPDQIDYLVDGFIQRGANGAIAALSGAGKSWVGIDLALAVASGSDWMGHACRQAPVAIISREDNPALTGWRMRRLMQGRGLWGEPENLWVNSRNQSPEFYLDNPRQVGEMRRRLQQLQPELVILDVLNAMHSADENDQREMRRIVMNASRLTESIPNCSLAVIHHFNKAESGSLRTRMRGSSAIAGWCEWIFGIRVSDPRTQPVIREAEYDSKAGSSPSHGFLIHSPQSANYSRIEKCDLPGRGGDYD